MLSNSITTEYNLNTILFDIVMFSHLNVSGIMSGALTTGDKLTGGTSGATGIVESLSTEGLSNNYRCKQIKSCCDNNVWWS